MAGVIEVSGLEKVFRVAEREGGMRASMRSLLKRQWRDVRAVDGIYFQVDAGEIVGFLGPTGAGRATTIWSPHPTGGGQG